MKQPDLVSEMSGLPRLGAHMSIAGGVHRALERGASIGCQTIQIFLKSNVQWEAPPLRAEEVAAFYKRRAASRIAPVFAHSCYLINLAAPNARVSERSVRALVDEIQRAELLGLPLIVLHPGSHMGSGEQTGLRRVTSALDQVFDATRASPVKIALETTAGQGTNLGYRFEHLAQIIQNVGARQRLAVCVDTCHLFAAGYDIRTAAGCEKVFAEFSKIVGFERLAAVHLNDSKGALGSRLDRHEHIGKGKIGREGFRWIVNAPRLRLVPMVLETPKGEQMDEDRLNLRVLRRLVRRG